MAAPARESVQQYLEGMRRSIDARWDRLSIEQLYDVQEELNAIVQWIGDRIMADTASPPVAIGEVQEGESEPPPGAKPRRRAKSDTDVSSHDLTTGQG